MRTDGRESDNIEDRRGDSGAGMPGGVRMGRGGLGIGAIAVALVASYFLGIDPRLVMSVLGGLDSGPPTQVQESAGPAPKPSDEIGRFVSVVLADTEDTWRAIFQRSGQEYEEPKLVLFSGAVQSACGMASAAV